MVKILIVDDETIECEALRRILSGKYGDECKLETAANGQAAIACAESFRAEIVLMDIEMPGMGGLEAAKIIKEMLPRCRVIILTAYQRFQYAQKAIALGAEEYLLKPVGNDELFETIDRAMENIRKDRESDERKSYLDQLAKEQFVLSAMSSYSNAQAMLFQLKELGLTFSHGFFLIVKSPKHISAERINGLLRPYLKNLRNMRFLTYEYDERVIMVVLMEEVFQRKEEIRLAIEKALLAAREKSGVTMFSGIGDIAIDVGGLQQSYNLANEALSLCTERCPVQFAVEGARESKRHGSLVNKLYQYLLDKDFESAARSIDVMLDTLFYVQHHSGGTAAVLERVLLGVGDMLSQDAREDMGYAAGISSLLNGRQSQEEISVAIRNLMTRWMRQIDAQPAARIHQIRDKIDRYISAHYGEDLSIRQIARDMHYSEPYFSKLFIRCFQRNFVTYLTDYRMQVAQEILSSPTINIKEVSAAVGYSDSNYFSKVFRKAYGVSPTEYRQLLYLQKSETEATPL